MSSSKPIILLGEAQGEAEQRLGNWYKLNSPERKQAIESLVGAGYTTAKIGEALGCPRGTIQSFCRRNKVACLSQGAQTGNTNAIIHGLSNNATKTKMRKAVKGSGRSLYICERCTYEDKYQMLPIHHKDRDRQNNGADNLEVLCTSCHAAEHVKDRIRNQDGTYV